MTEGLSTVDETTGQGLAREIYDAERAAVAVAPLSARFPTLTPDDAYAIQEWYAGMRRRAGATLVGRKIGCTSAAIQQLFGIDTPDYGQLFDDMRIPDGASVDPRPLIAPRIEPEIAFVLDRDLRGPGLTSDDVLAATRAVAPALEIIDSRVRDWEIGFVDTVADNGSSARFVIGPEVPYRSAMDLAAAQVWLVEDGQRLHNGTGAAVLGHPAHAVAWLANVLAGYDRGLRAGQYVLSGSMTTAVPLAPGRRYEAVFDTLASASCEVTTC
jgi:2-keto-4-pentenoate hydratase